MKKLAIALGLLTLTYGAFASNVDMDSIFADNDGCFILYNVSQEKLITEYNPPFCQQEVSPDSTFKIALSLMAFDQNLISQNTVFKWNGKVDPDHPKWNQNQTPKTWLQYSVVWVSQQLTTQLGMANIKDYLKEFNYGNQDFSGDPGKNNGLTHAWLDSSLKISPEEQLTFLQNLIEGTLPVSPEAKSNTIANMYLGTTTKGWKLYGKTGSGFDDVTQMPLGWFEGFIKKGSETYIFVLDFVDTATLTSSYQAGSKAQIMVQQILTQMNLY